MEVVQDLPRKSHFKLDEVCRMTGVKPYVLRFWETEFAEISPIISSSGQKMYEPSDVEVIKTIKDLLFAQKKTIEQAKYEISLMRSEPVNLEEVVEEETIELIEVAASMRDESTEN